MKGCKINMVLTCILGLLLNVSAFAGSEPSDSTKDTVVVRDIMQWDYNASHTERSRVDIDTTMDFFYLYEPNGSIADYLVNVAEYASPAFSLLFIPRYGDMAYIRAYDKSIVETDDMPDYTAQRPYSNLFYSQGLNSEQSAKFIHTQNVNRFCNVGFNLNFYKMIGEYDNQGVKGQHVTPWISYYGPRFTTVFKYAFNNINRQENGGIAADSLLHYEKLLRMKHTNASSSLRFQNVSFMQKWNMGRKAKIDSSSLDIPRYKNAIGYRMNYYSTKRYYSDSNIDTAFYNAVYYDSTSTCDTLKDKILQSVAFLEFQRKIRSIGVVANFGLGVEFSSTRYHDYAYTIPEYFGVSHFYEGIFDVTLPWEISLSHQHCYYFEGSDKNSFDISTNLSKSFLIGDESLEVSIGQEYSMINPENMICDYESNHYIWHNNYDYMGLHDVQASANSSFGNVEAEIHYYSIENYLSFDEKGVVSQAKGRGNAFTAKLTKTTRLPHILLKNGMMYQNVSVGQLEYPNWATYNSLAVQGAFLRKLIQVQIGGDILFYPAYHAPTYDAVLGDFLPQSTYSYGKFPIMNVFVTLKYKPIKLYVKYTNLYSLLKEQNYTIAGYPQSNGTISFGISWMFYN